MGLETICTARWNGREAEGRLQLEGTELLFRGPFRLKLALTPADARVRGGELIVPTPEGDAAFSLGEKAEVWAARIRTPRTLLDKLGVKPGQRISLAGRFDAAFLAQLPAYYPEPAPDCDIVFLAAACTADLDRLATAAPMIQAKGAVWVVYPKGRKDITEMQVLTAIRAAGLTDVKVCSFSPTHTALKGVIPVKARKSAAKT